MKKTKHMIDTQKNLQLKMTTTIMLIYLGCISLLVIGWNWKIEDKKEFLQFPVIRLVDAEAGILKEEKKKKARMKTVNICIFGFPSPKA